MLAHRHFGSMQHQRSRHCSNLQVLPTLPALLSLVPVSQLPGPFWTHGSSANLPGHVVCHEGKKLGIVLGGIELAKCGVCALERGNTVHWAERARGAGTHQVAHMTSACQRPGSWQRHQVSHNSYCQLTCRVSSGLRQRCDGGSNRAQTYDGPAVAFRHASSPLATGSRLAPGSCYTYYIATAVNLCGRCRAEDLQMC